MGRHGHLALSAAAGTCLTVCACGSGAAPAAGGSVSATPTASATGSAILTGRYCIDSGNFIRHISAAPSQKNATAAQARSDLREVLRSTVAGFRALETEAPHNLEGSLKTIRTVYKSDEKTVTAGHSIAQITQAMVRVNSRQSAAFQRVLKYIGTHCRQSG